MEPLSNLGPHPGPTAALEQRISALEKLVDKTSIGSIEELEERIAALEARLNSTIKHIIILEDALKSVEKSLKWMGLLRR